ncbi:hypothetical protein [Microbispora triticiradicis]|uniref:Uncharacterized protein n=2 Tax=Microbispora TaxID=2005 RepID=A0ABY3LZ91_9ACTN|nr:MULTISPECIES: hypothetical protein [Microbispora]TLP63952.1 hypothetical protein FED44_06925 [Microbispora fusca]TYB60793.1 hypothetical protein FXF59_12995 [Microbispora tritici]
MDIAHNHAQAVMITVPRKARTTSSLGENLLRARWGTSTDIGVLGVAAEHDKAASNLLFFL